MMTVWAGLTPSTIRATVDLPEPDSPTNAVVVPRCRAKVDILCGNQPVLKALTR